MSKQESSSGLHQNLFYNLIYQVVVILAPLVVTPKLSRVLGPDYIGLKSFTFSIVYYFAVCGVLGLDIYGQKKIAEYKEDKEKRSKMFLQIASLRVILCSVSTLIFVMIFIVFNNDTLTRSIYLCWLIYLVREIINPIWYLQGREQYKYISITNIISQILYVASVFIFVDTKEDILKYIVFYTLIPLIISILYIPKVIKDIKFVSIASKEWIPILKEALIYFVPTIATALYSMLDKTMLGFFDPSKVSTGFYEQAEKLVKVALAFSTASFTIMRTRMTYVYCNSSEDNYKKHASLFISISMFLCWPIMFGIVGISNDFVPLFFGKGYESVVSLSKIFSLVVPCLTISGMLQAIYVFPQGLQNMMNRYYLVALTINAVLNSIFIPIFASYGAAMASVMAELILALFLIIRAKHSIPVKKIISTSGKYILSSVVMLIVMKYISRNIDVATIYKVVIEFSVGIIVYIVICIILRDNFLIEMIKSVLLRIQTKFISKK